MTPGVQLIKVTLPTPFPDEIANWKVWKPSLGGFTFQLPAEWSTVSIDGGNFSEIRMYSSKVSWEEAHRLEKIGDLTFRIALELNNTEKNNRLTWNNEGNLIKSSIINFRNSNGLVTFTGEYPSDSKYKKDIDYVIRTLNFNPSNAELTQVNIIPQVYF